MIDRAMFDQGLADEAARHGVVMHPRPRVGGRRRRRWRDRVVHGDASIRGADVRAGLRRQLRAAAQARAGDAAPAPAVGAGGAAGRSTRCRGSALRRGASRRAASPGPCRCSGPKAGSSASASCAMHDASRHFRRMVEMVGPRWGLSAGRCRPRQKVLPLGPIDRTYGDRLLVLGDAAGLVKPTTGGGIYYSLLSARIAAEVLGPALTSDALGADTLAAYEVDVAEGDWLGAAVAAHPPAHRPAARRRPTSRDCSSSRAPTASCRSCAAPPASTGTASSSSPF